MTEAIDWTPKARAILRAASDLFYAEGIHAVGVEAIAARAGVTKKTLYDRFGSKDRLVVTYLTERDREWRVFLDGRLDGAGGEPSARLAELFDAAGDWHDERGGKGCSMINAHAEISDPAHPAYSVITDQKRWMLGFLTDLAADAGVSDPDRVGAELMLLHEGALVASGIGVIKDAFATARDAAVARLAASSAE